MTLSTRPAILSLVLLAACSGTSAPSGTTDEVRSAVARDPAGAVSPAALSAAVGANNAFAAILFANLEAGQTGNLVTSPLSASLALTMTYAGARGQTATQMAAALHIDTGNGPSIFDGQNAIDQELNGRANTAFSNAQETAPSGAPPPSADDYVLNVVNSLWGERTYTWQPAFLDTMAKSYGAGVHIEDFIHQWEAARTAINGWVSQETADKINGLLPEGTLDTTTRLVLVDAIHLKLPWQTPFVASSTLPAAFAAPSGSVMVPFMHAARVVPYADDGQAQTVALPLADGSLSVVFTLPHAGVDLSTVEATLSASSQALAVPPQQGSVSLSLPKVGFTTPAFSLVAALQAMGMTDAFDAHLADFSGLSTNPLYVSDVLQKAMLAFDERGTEAAGATAVVASTLSGPPPTQAVVVFDRPFLVSIVDGATGAVLFLGHIVDPSDAGAP